MLPQHSCREFLEYGGLKRSYNRNYSSIAIRAVPHSSGSNVLQWENQYKATEACPHDERVHQAECVAPCICYAAVGRAGVRADEVRGAEICIQTHTAFCVMRKATAPGTSDWSEASTQSSQPPLLTPHSSQICVQLFLIKVSCSNKTEKLKVFWEVSGAHAAWI